MLLFNEISTFNYNIYLVYCESSCPDNDQNSKLLIFCGIYV